jgi:rhodanese-related sulfurtransferase
MLDEEYKRTVPFIQPQELYQKILKGEKMHLLDTREGREYEISAIKGAIHVGFLFFSKRKIETVNTNDLIIVYCTIGARSETIGARLKKNGFQNVYNLYGGIIQWVNEGLPVYHNNKKTAEVHVYSKKWGVWLNKGKARY